MSGNATPQVQQILDALPTTPGCYLMKDGGGTVIYVGKAVNLRSRVRSYFHQNIQHGYNLRTRELVSRIRDIEIIVVGSELEALLLEMRLIKRYRPRYNVRLKDDKSYPYIKINTSDPFPKVLVTRRLEKDKHSYFGPYTSMWAVHQTLDTLRKAFPYLTCDREITGQDARACLYYDIKLCNGPCIGAVDQAEYGTMIAGLIRFLQGETETIVTQLKADMAAAAEALDYERAAVHRDQLVAIERIVERQRVVSPKKVDSDVIAFAREQGETCVQVFFIRAGKMIGREYFVLEGTEEADDHEIMAQFLKQFYNQAAYVPPDVYLPADVEEAQIIETWLRTRRGTKVSLKVPRRGAKRDLVKLAAENATQTLGMLRARWAADTNRYVDALAKLQAALTLPNPPGRIECYDISNIQGTAATGSMVVFHQGTPAKSHYRNFTIKTVSGPNDYASMGEVLTRRLQRWQDAQADDKPPGYKPDPSFSRLPDLLIVDGGKGQLGVAVEVLAQFGLTERVPVAGLAKREEELFLPGRSTPVMLPRKSPELFLVQNIRDEAHRVAITHHRKRRRKAGLASQLDAIPGIGPAKRKALLQKFGSLDRIRTASVDELAEVPGITRALAQVVKSQL